MSRTVLLVDDDESTLLLLRRFFELKGWRVHQTKSAQEAISLFENERPFLVVLDLRLPYLSGIELLEILRERDPDPAIVMLTGHADVETAVSAMRLGAENYLSKPVSLDHLEAIAEKAVEKVVLRRSNRVLTAQQEHGSPVTEALRHTPALQGLEESIGRVAESDVTVLLIGETGTGKTRVAKLIHGRSARAKAPFIEVSCAALSRENLEQRLFGEEKVTSRGKRVEPRGLFEVADGGTLLLDQIGLLDKDLQPRLLQVLETQRLRRVGGTEEVAVDVRIIAAANADLEAEVRLGRFREELYYRLAVVPLRLPPLREWSRADIVATATELLRGLQDRRDGADPIQIGADAADLLGRYLWPGNLRQMRNTLERILILNPRMTVVLPEHLPPEIAGVRQGDPGGSFDPTLPMEEVERSHIAAALKHFGGNRSQTAQSLRISRRALYDKLEKFGLDAVR